MKIIKEGVRPEVNEEEESILLRQYLMIRKFRPEYVLSQVGNFLNTLLANQSGVG